MAAIGDVEHPVALALEAIGGAAQPFPRAVARPADDERGERTRIPIQLIGAQELEQLDSDILGDVIGGILVHEPAGGSPGDGEDAGEERFFGGEVQIGDVLHESTRRRVVG